MSIREIVALQVGERSLDLAALLRFARVRDGLGFLNDALRSLALRSLAAERGLAVGDDELQAESDAFRAEHRLAAVADMQAWLAARGIGMDDLSDFESMLEERVLRRKLCAQIPQASVEREFTLRRGDLDTATIARILVSEESAADEIRAQAEEGAEFGALARAHSQDAETAPAGGHVGSVGRVDLPRLLADDVFAAGPGAIVGPARGDDGWVVLRVEQLRPAALNEATANALREGLVEAALAAQVQGARLPIFDLL